DDDRLDLVEQRQVSDRTRDRAGGAAVLHRRIAPDHRAFPAAPLEPREEVAPRGAPLGGDDPDRARKRRDAEPLLPLEEALRRKLPAQPLEAGEQVALARWAHLVDAEHEAGRRGRAARVEVAAAGDHDRDA